MKFYTSEYRASSKWPYAISSGSVVYRQSGEAVEVLLLKRAAGDFPQLKDGHTDSYHLPKGHISINETLEQAALRETAEETGCAVKLTTYLGAKLHQYVDHKNIRQDKIVHYFAGEWQSDLDTMDDEHSDKLWVELREAINLIGEDNPKREDEILKRLQKFLNTPAV